MNTDYNKLERRLRSFLVDLLAIVFSAVIIWGSFYCLARWTTRDDPDQQEPEQIQPVQTSVEPKAEAVATEPAAYDGPIPEIVALGEFKITHYCACELCCGQWAEDRPGGVVYTASGSVAQEGRTIAVDPDLIPYGTEVVVRFSDGDEAVYVAEDCGGAIQGNHIDVYMGSHEAALAAGVRSAEVYIVKEI